MNKIRLMPDYGCFPLWNLGGMPYALDENSLPLSRSLLTDITRWAQEYDNTLNQEDPLSSGFTMPEKEDDFVRRGASLAHRLHSELGGGTVIEYKYVSNRARCQEVIS